MNSGEEGIVDPAEAAVDLMRTAAHAMRSVTCSPTDEARAVFAAVNGLLAHGADLLAVIDETKAHESEGAASVATWAARELHQDPGTTRQMVKASATMRDLPTIGAAAHTGRVSVDHVHACTYGLKHVGHDQTVALEPELLDVALEHTPRDLFNLMRYAKAIIHSDKLDEAWLNGMDKEDFRCLRVGDGFQPDGFLGPDIGAKLKAYLTAAAVPRDGDDDRTAAQRRIDALDELLTAALGDQLPSCRARGAEVNVIVDAETLKQALNRGCQDASQGELLDREPAILEGFGPIGPALLTYIAFGGNLTHILVDGFKANRKATLRRAQRDSRAPFRTGETADERERQRARPGYHHPIGEIHHIIGWLYGGKTNLNNLAGLCRKCHALITTGQLLMTGTYETGYTFTTTRDRPLARTG